MPPTGCPRQRILQACYAAFSRLFAAVAGLHVARAAAVYPIYLVLLWNGVVRAFNGRRRRRFCPLLVPEEHFPNGGGVGRVRFPGRDDSRADGGRPDIRLDREPAAGVSAPRHCI